MTRRSKTIFVKSVWVMLSVFFSLLFAFIAVGRSIAFENSAPINSLLGINPYNKIQLGSGDEDMEHFKSDYVKKNADGSYVYKTEKDGYKHQVYDDVAMRAASEKVAEQTAVEGSVLLWNNKVEGKPALPLSKNAGVSVYGMGAYNYVLLGNGSGGMSLDPKKGSLAIALRDKGIAANSALNSKYLSLLNKYGRKLGNYGSSRNYQTWFTVNEPPWNEVESVTTESIASYNDAAVMVVSRTAGEDYDISQAAPPADAKDDNGNPIDAEVYVDGSANYLELTREEGEILRNLNGLKSAGKLKSVVLLLNTANPMQFKSIVKDEYGVDACVWVGMGGTMSFAQVADVLAGHDEFAVSGRATDTLVYDSYSAPSYANFGDFTWTEMSDKLPDLEKEYGAYYQTHNMKYMVYQEGIYVGYRYYETRYEDYVLGRGNSGAYDYSKTVAFPFGYGKGYADFEYSAFDVNETDNAYEVSLNIKNKADSACKGKDVLQVYLQKPYDHDSANEIEKAAVELVGFAKTDLLAPGESQTLTVTVDKEQLRTYDAYGKETYILEAGDYYLSVGTDAHNALNNILAKKGYTPANTDNRMDAAGNADYTHKINVAADDYDKYSISEDTTNEIANRFDEADLNRYEGTADQRVTYLSRRDWKGTFPTEEVKLKCVNDKMVEDMQYGHEIEVKEGDELPKYDTVTAAEGRLNISMLADLEYDDPKWEDLLNQMTLEEQHWMGSYGLHFFAGAASVDAPGGNSKDGPGGVKVNNPTIGTQFGFPSPVVMAATWNTPLIEKLGVAFAHEALHANVTLVYAPGANIHRSPLGGRNWEYFSEDGFISGEMLCAEITGLQKRGIIVMTKHFALNDQERNRYGVATFFNEQSAREIYLKPFEIAVRKGGMNGIMTSFNRLGLTWAGSHKGLLTDILRNEWDFLGIVETDSCTGNTYHMGTKYAKGEGLVAGNDMWMANGSKEYFSEWEDNATVMLALREACHRILYTQLNSAAMNGMSMNTRLIPAIPWWQAVLNAALIVTGALTALFVVMAVLSFVFGSAKYKKFRADRASAKAVCAVSAANARGTETVGAVSAPRAAAFSDGTGGTPSDGGHNSSGGSGGGKRPSFLTPKRKKILLICVSAVLVVAVVLVSVLVPLNCNNGDEPEKHVCESVCEVCGKCLDSECDDPVCAEKCGGHVVEHVCESECPECGKCLDLDCTETVCKDKCNEGRTAYVFEAEDSVIVNGTASYAKYNIRTNNAGKDNERTYVADLNQNYGATLTFTVIADENTTASLGITITRRNVDTVFTDKFGVSVNKGRDLIRPVTVPAYKDQWLDSSFADFNLGCVDLVKGSNTIVFTVQTPGDMSGYNFDKITLYSEKPLTAPEPEHECESACAECGKCMDDSCAETVCADKCEGHDLNAQQITATSAKLGKGAKGLPTPEPKTEGLMGNLSENKGASLSFAFKTATAGKAKLVAAVTTRDKDVKFTEAITVKVNGGDYPSEAVVPTQNGKNDWFNSVEIELGEIELLRGANTLVFEVATDSSKICFNFHYVKIVRADIAPEAHVCESVCPEPECGKCLDSACTESVCAEKCSGHNDHNPIVTRIDSVTEAKRGGGVKGLPNKSGSVSGNLSQNEGASLTFEFFASEVGSAKLIAAVTTRDVDYKFTDVFNVYVNDSLSPLVSDAVIKSTGSNNWSEATEFELGEISLKAGVNEVVFEVASTGQGVNFGYIVIESETETSSHVCSQVCSDCGKCTDQCTEIGCADKCPDYVSKHFFGTEAQLGEGTKGLPKAEPQREGLMGNLSENVGATLTYKFNASVGSAKLLVAVTTRNKDIKFTEGMSVSVNGGEPHVSEAVIKATTPDNWYDSVVLDLGEITLADGENTVVFTVTNANNGFNFHWMSVVTAVPTV